MVSLEITNSLLRVDAVTGVPRAPFERPNETLDFFVLELPSDSDVGRWSAEVAHALQEHEDYLHSLRAVGARLTLFVQYSGYPAVLRFEPWFVSALGAANIGFECFYEAA